uniref:Uncharacterized protein n=1 Tax=Leptobrachium leishanense TaxID=445787 RepID=A0A8C5LUQ2_9ANUR
MFCNMSRNPLMWCKIAWKVLLNFFQEIFSVLTSSHATSSKKIAQCFSFSQNSRNAETEELRENIKIIQYTSTSSIEKIQNIEKQCDNLESDLTREKELWKAVYEELKKELEELKEQHHRYINEEKTLRTENKMEYIAVSDRNAVPLGDETDGLNRRIGALVKAVPYNHDDFPDCGTVDGPPTLTRCLSSSSFDSHAPSVSSLKTPKPCRVFAPRSPWELKIGSRVKVLLPSGKVGIGYVCHVEQLPMKVEFQVGVDLETTERQQQVYMVKGHHSSQGKEDLGVFVPFSKVLMAWE